jgi:hypothetical protein
MSMTPAQQNTVHLMQALHFDAEELMLNRQGQLSPAQAQRVGGQLRAGSAAMWKISLFVLIIFVIGFAALFLFGAIELDNEMAPIVLIGVGATMLLWGVMVGVGFIRSRRMASRDTWHVHAVSGRVKVSMPSEWTMTPEARAAMDVGGPGVADGLLQIGKTYLAIWAEGAQAFIPGNPYTVYYVGSKRGGLPVSAEAMEDTGKR